jgi:acetyltransferase-like isoleucine patch superfamily enzyme
VRKLFTLVLFLLPATRAKNFLLRRCGHPVHPTASIGPSVVYGVGRFEAGPNTKIVFGNVFRGLVSVRMAEGSTIGQLNWFSTAPTFVGETPEAATLTLGDGAAIVSRHYIDCSGGVTLEQYSIVGGVRSTLLTHQADHLTGLLEFAPIRICQYALLNGNNKMVAGAVLPERSITGIGAVVLPGLREPARLYAGVPARDIKSVEGGGLFHRDNPAITL